MLGFYVICYGQVGVNFLEERTCELKPEGREWESPVASLKKKHSEREKGKCLGPWHRTLELTPDDEKSF